MAPTSIDGNDITGATIDGQDVSEITVDGDVVFTAGPDIPDSGLLHSRYDATELQLSDGDVVDPFPDEKSTNDLPATGGPTYQTNVINGNPVVREDGVDDNHSNTFTTVSQPFTQYAVVNIRSVATGDNEFYWDDASTTFSNRVLNNQGQWQIADSGGSTNGGTVSAGTHIVGAIWDGGNSELRVDGAIEISTTTTDDLGGFLLAENSNGGNNSPIDFGEILQYDGLPNTSDVETYLSNKWGITI